MAKANTNDIVDINIPWDGYAGSSVEKFIKDELKKLCGFIKRTDERTSDGHHHLYGFHDEETYLLWEEEGSNISDTKKILFNITLPELENSIFTGKLTTNIEDKNKTLINLGQGIKIKFRYLSILTNPITQEINDTGNSGTLIISNSSNNSGFVDVGSEEIHSVLHNTENVYSKEIDISKYLSVGINKLRFRVIDSNGNMSNTELFSSIINTTLKLTNTTDVTKTLRDDSFILSYKIEGSVNKNLNIIIRQNNVIKYDNTLNPVAIGETIWNERSKDIRIENHNCQPGMIEVESWLSVVDDPTLESNHINTQLHYSNSTISDNIDLLLNNKLLEITNNSFVDFFDFVLYSNSSEDIDVNILIKDIITNEIYLNYTENNCKSGINLKLSNKVEILNNDNDVINAIVFISTKLHSNNDFIENDSYNITINNIDKIKPTEGADFILDPNTRNNNESNPAVIINETNKNLIDGCTFTNFDFTNDGWITTDDGKILRIPAKHSLTINYDPFKSNNHNAVQQGVTIEMDYKINNIFNDNEIILDISNKSYTSNTPTGFIMKGTKAVFYTQNKKEEPDQDVMFQEGVRTHMTINIFPKLDKNNNNVDINYIRIFINGIINREMTYDTTDKFEEFNGQENNYNIQIGADDCDIDIYGIRIYRFGLSSSEILNDYICTIPNSDIRKQIKEANNIIADGKISYDLVKNKYNTLIWSCSDFFKDKDGNITNINIPCLYAKYLNPDINYEPKGTLLINKFKRDDNGNFIVDGSGSLIKDKEHSGIITNLKCKGQGSSSKKYWKWNQQYDWNKLKDENEQPIKSIWIDDNGDEHNDGYKLVDNNPPATKLVAKINWASSMQSHKIGSTALYTDLWRVIVGGNGITKLNDKNAQNARVSVYEEPFLFFIKTEESNNPEFYGLMTFGSGKYDKLTFGYSNYNNDKNITIKDEFLMLEGTDNERPLTNRQVPWIDDEITYNTDEEYYEYAGVGNIDYGMGNILEPKSKNDPEPDEGWGYHKNLTKFKDAFNFIYQHAIRLKPYLNNDELIDTTYQYWYAGEDIHDEDNNIILKKGDIKRYNYISNTWVDAGITKTDGKYDKFNIFTQILNFTQAETIEESISNKNNDEINNYFITERINHFKNNIQNYYDIDDVTYSIAFLKLIGATDNRCKNTYEYYDPFDKIIRMAQDDMDTIFHIDNVGRKNKPYYIEEHDFFQVKENNTYIDKSYFNGEDNNFFTLMDNAFKTKIDNMLKDILSTMSDTNFGGSINGCFQKYFYWVQEYFPAVAYNETTKLLYEDSQKYYGTIYSPSIAPMAQSLGNQLEAEKEWINKRILYLKSYLAYGEFKGDSSDITVRPSITYKDLGEKYYLYVKPWQWLYPSITSGQNKWIFSRTPANEIYSEKDKDGNPVLGISINNLYVFDQNITLINGKDYYLSYGNIAGISVGSQPFYLSGERLRDFFAEYDENNNKFAPTSIDSINCPNLTLFSLPNCTSLTGSINFNKEIKLEEVNLINTNLTAVVFPETGTLKSIKLPRTLQSLKLVNCPNINSVVFQGYEEFISIEIDNISNVENNPTKNFEIFDNILTYSNKLSEIKLYKVNIDFSNDLNKSNKLYNLLINESSICEGKIKLNKELSFEEQQTLINKYGNINLENNKLYIEYKYKSGTGNIIGDTNITKGKTKNYKLNYTGNNIYNCTWQIKDMSNNILTDITIEQINLYEINIIIPISFSIEHIKVCSYASRKNTTDLEIEKPINIIDDNPIESIEIDLTNVKTDNNGYILCGKSTEYIIPIIYLPTNNTSVINNKNVIIDHDYMNLTPYITINSSNVNNNEIKFQYNRLVDTAPISGKIHVSVNVDNNKQIEKDVYIKLINPITKLSIDQNTNIIWEKNN